MRQLFIFSLAFCFFFTSVAQTPKGINFQTILHETHGSIIPNHSVKMIISILKQEANGDIVYREQHSLESNEFGLINFQIGTGEVLYGIWDEISWGEFDHYMLVELDNTGSGSYYEEMGVAQLLSVPYALHAYQSTDLAYWQNNELGIFYLDGDIGIKTENPTEVLELGDGEAISLSSTQASLDANDLVQVRMGADTAHPNMNWSDSFGEFAVSISARGYTSNPMTLRKQFLIATSNDQSSRAYRMELKYDEDMPDFIFNYSNLFVDGDFKVGDETQAATSSFYAHNWIHNSLFGIGNKDWASSGLYGVASAESFSSGTGNFILLHSANDQLKSQVKFLRGSAHWVCTNENSFAIKRNDSKKIRIMENGNIKIGSTDPEYKLEVYGNINIPEGCAYLIGGGKSGKFAEYFETEELLKVGDLAGINMESGLVKKYENGDYFLGIVCEPTGFIGNSNKTSVKNNQFVLVGMEGLMEFQSSQIIQKNHQAFTSDGKLIGQIIGNQILMN